MMYNSWWCKSIIPFIVYIKKHENTSEITNITHGHGHFTAWKLLHHCDDKLEQWNIFSILDSSWQHFIFQNLLGFHLDLHLWPDRQAKGTRVTKSPCLWNLKSYSNHMAPPPVIGLWTPLTIAKTSISQTWNCTSELNTFVNGPHIVGITINHHWNTIIRH